MQLNRAVIKTQARELIAGKVFSLFLISFVITLIVGGTNAFNYTVNRYSNYAKTNQVYSEENYSSNYLDEFLRNFEDDAPNESDNPIDSFGGNLSNMNTTVLTTEDSQNGTLVSAYVLTILASISSMLSIVSILCSALMITLSGYYVTFIRTARDINVSTDLPAIFKNTFNKTYGAKLSLYVLRSIFTFLLSFLFIIPGVIYWYSTYFAFEIMADHPELKASQALKLSKQLIKDNRSELFVLDLSFIPWYILIGCTFGIASIYVLPYTMTTKALYYENFLRRAIATGQITEDDFLSDKERFEKYGAPQGGFNPNQYYQQQGNNYNPSAQPTYQPPQYNGQGQQQPENVYYQPPQDTPTPPAEPPAPDTIPDEVITPPAPDSDSAEETE